MMSKIAVPAARRPWRLPPFNRAAPLACAAALTLAVAGLAEAAECRPEKMVRIVTRNVSPDADPNSFAARPKTLYRLGSRYGRLEEEPDREGGKHLLTVINEPDIWIANLLDRTGRHIVDAGPSLKFHAPVVWSEDLPIALKDLEYGCEVAFVKERAATPPEPDRLDGARVERYEIVEGRYTLTLLVGRPDGKPRALDLRKDSKIVFGVRYVIYEDRLEPDPSLFDTPRRIRFSKG